MQSCTNLTSEQRKLQALLSDWKQQHGPLSDVLTECKNWTTPFSSIRKDNTYGTRAESCLLARNVDIYSRF